MSGGVSIELHPLVVMNISDHFTRARHQNPKEAQVRVIGAIIGKQQGRVIELVNTVELSFKRAAEADGSIQIDDEFCSQRLDAYKKLFPDLDCLGWYSSTMNNQSDLPTNADVIVHKKMQRFTENPLYIIMNTESKEA